MIQLQREAIQFHKSGSDSLLKGLHGLNFVIMSMIKNLKMKPLLVASNVVGVGS